MRKLFLILSLCVPLVASAQYVGNPAGKTEPLGITQPQILFVRGMGGVEGGYHELDVKTRYDVKGGNIYEKSRLQEGYVAVTGSGHALGAELEAKVGITFPELKESAFAGDPFADGTGIIAGLGARWGFPIFSPVRLGLGGQFTYSDSSGNSGVPLESGGSSTESSNLTMWRGDLFTGLGVDLPFGRWSTIAPYLGAGIQLIDGKLKIKNWQSDYVFNERMGTIKQDRLEFFFGGVDLFLGDNIRLGIEGRGNGNGAGVFANFCWRF